MEAKEFSSIQEITPKPREFTPRMGQEIIIQRTNGHIEGGWKIDYMNEDMLLVARLDSYGKKIERTVFRSNVERFNRPPKVEDISTSQNIGQLKFAIKELGGVQGSKQFLPADYILSCIDDVSKNGSSEESLRKFTSNHDLRDTVKRLIESKK